MTTRPRKWLPMALCCLPGVTVAAILGISWIVGGAAVGAMWGGPVGLGLISLALLACPVSMSPLMWRQRQLNPESARRSVSPMVNCCLPGETLAASESDNPSQRLAELRARRQALERELAKMVPQ